MAKKQPPPVSIDLGDKEWRIVDGPEEDEPGEFDALRANPFTALQIQESIDKVEWKPNVEAEVEKRVDMAVWAFRLHRRLSVDEDSPSDRERQFIKVQNKLHSIAKALQELPQSYSDQLQSAAQDLANANGSSHDLEFEAFQARVDWLIRCVARAIERTNWEKSPHGGPVPDVPLHMLLLELDSVYFKYAKHPRKPHGRTVDESELLDFFIAVLNLLGIDKNRKAIYSHWARAMKDEEK